VEVASGRVTFKARRERRRRPRTAILFINYFLSTGSGT
jgi:hypothetical protein